MIDLFLDDLFVGKIMAKVIPYVCLRCHYYVWRDQAVPGEATRRLEPEVKYSKVDQNASPFNGYFKCDS